VEPPGRGGGGRSARCWNGAWVVNCLSQALSVTQRPPTTMGKGANRNGRGSGWDHPFRQFAFTVSGEGVLAYGVSLPSLFTTESNLDLESEGARDGRRKSPGWSCSDCPPRPPECKPRPVAPVSPIPSPAPFNVHLRNTHGIVRRR
jgi:hypothetical protein